MKTFEYKDPTVENGKYIVFEIGDCEFVNPIEYYRDAYIQKQIRMYWAISSGLKKEFEKNKLEMSDAEIQRLFEKRALSDWEEFFSEKSATKIKPNYLGLLEAERKPDQEKLLKGQTISTYELFAFIIYAFKELGLTFSQYTFRHSQKGIAPTDLTDFTHIKEDGTVVTSRETKLSDGQLKQAVEHRVVMVAKFIGDNENWHCFFTNYKSLKGKEKAYKGGQPHFHYISSKWGMTREQVIEQLSNRKYKLPSIPHLDYEK